MKIGDKVIITGGTQKDWHKHGKPYYANIGYCDIATEGRTT